MPPGAPTSRQKASRRRRHPRKGTSRSGLVAQGPLFGPAAFPAVRILAAPPTGLSQFPRTAPPNPRRGGKAARLKSEPCATFTFKGSADIISNICATPPESGGELAANSPPQMRRGGAPSAGVVLNVWPGEPTVPQIHQ
jgi:hypothetical protein